MLDEIQKKYSEVYENHFKEIFKDGYDVKCEWGFPVIKLEFSNPKSEIIFNIDIRSGDYGLFMKGKEMKDEVEVPAFAALDSSTLKFIVERTILISENLFGAEPEPRPDEVEPGPDKAESDPDKV
jgi:hypothetical protein